MSSQEESNSESVEFAYGIEVPFQADNIASPELRYGVGESEENQTTCLVVWTDDGSEKVGVVTFEGFDSVRCCRGEYLPYPDNGTLSSESLHFPWVFEVENSRWLMDRHEYEFKHYDTPLLSEYVHYLFSFHDEFVELIAKGVWFEKVAYDQVAFPRTRHPLLDLSQEFEAEEFTVSGISCQVRHNPLPMAKLIENSRLCSQKLFQYFLTLDGITEPSYSAQLRTLRGRGTTRLRNRWFYPDLLEYEGVADESGVRPAFKQYVAKVAERRRQKGKS